MTNNRESRNLLAVILMTAAGVIAVNLAVNPGGLPDGVGVVGLILALLAGGIWALSWRESVADKAYFEPESEPVVTPVAVLPAAVPPAPALAPLIVEAAIPHAVLAPVILQAAPVFEAVAPEPEPAVEVVIGDAPVVEPEPTPVVAEMAAAAPTTLSIEVQAETVVHDAAAAPETPPNPKPMSEDSRQPVQVVQPEPAPESAPVGVPVSEPEPEPAPVSEPEPAPAPVSEPESVDSPLHEGEGQGVRASAQPDELTKLEGIGPYYREALHKLGIMTFAQLSQQNADSLVAQLKANGFRQHPSIPTWAEQAGLAAAGDWEGLAALQAQLDGGRRAGG